MWIKTKTALQCDFLPAADAKISYMIERIDYFDQNNIISWIAKSCEKKEPSLQGEDYSWTQQLKNRHYLKTFWWGIISQQDDVICKLQYLKPQIICKIYYNFHARPYLIYK